MNVVYDQENEVLNIDDGLKMRNMIIVSCALFNIFLSYMQLRKGDLFHLNFNEFTWLAIGSFSLLYIILFLIKYSFAEKIPLDEIIGLEKNEEYSGNTFFILLKNGKKRKLYKMRTLEEYDELEKLLKHISD
ncbi:hypothetical protein GO491_04200 [Flavobacteriaceae bacterium Ap0902]|nr:hypothetical protein [Flavobacteriaceae bacterium Ap0902]